MWESNQIPIQIYYSELLALNVLCCANPSNLILHPGWSMLKIVILLLYASWSSLSCEDRCIWGLANKQTKQVVDHCDEINQLYIYDIHILVKSNEHYFGLQIISSSDMTITTPSSSVPGPIAKPRSNSTSSNYSSESSHIGSGYQRAPGSEREENTFVSIDELMGVLRTVNFACATQFEMWQLFWATKCVLRNLC